MIDRRTGFSTVEQAQRLARRRLPASVYGALVAGSERGLTAEDNVRAFAELGLVPGAVAWAGPPRTSTSVMGQPVSLPVLLSPTGVQAVHPDGEVAVARAAAAQGTAMGLSSFASMPMEAVVAANPATVFQLCWTGSRDSLLVTLERARSAGVAGLILTLDWTFSQGRDGGSPAIPERVDVRTALRFAPEVLRRPGWLARFVAAGHIPDLTVPNLAPRPGGRPPTFFAAYRDWMATPPPSWADVAWLRSQWDGPFMVKGIGRVDDARRAVDAGATAISVSSHGGNNLDGTLAPIRTLGPVAAAVGGQVEILLDGGIRWGSDVVKALALGADAVMIGRPYLWGLAAGGQAGVERVLGILRGGVERTLVGLRRASIDHLRPEDLLVPEGFSRCARARR